MKIIVISGPPYSGKGTQCELIEEEFGYKQISLGELCRKEKSKNTAEADIIRLQEETGALVPNYIIKKLFTDALKNNIDISGIIIDGYPRTKEQSDNLLDILKENNLEIDYVFNIDVRDSILLERAKLRAKTSDRIDDKDQSIHLNRLKIYTNVTKPGINYLGEHIEVINFNGEQNIEEVYNDIRSYLIK